MNITDECSVCLVVRLPLDIRGMGEAEPCGQALPRFVLIIHGEISRPDNAGFCPRNWLKNWLANDD